MSEAFLMIRTPGRWTPSSKTLHGTYWGGNTFCFSARKPKPATPCLKAR